jgi:menaquinone-dependent protoporphyrinogen oxidase
MMNERTRFSRRQFLVGCAGIAGAGLLACGGLGVVAVQSPEINMVDTQAQAGQTQHKILVTYATRAGSTAEVAEAIGQVLSANGAAVDVRPVQKVTDIDGYSAMIVGSAVRIGKWLPEAVDFVAKNQSRLNGRPVAIFSVHLSHVGNDEADQKARLAYTASVRQVLTPRAEVFFAGKMDFTKLSWLDRVMMSGKTQERDLRDWDAIRAWTNGLGPTL